MGNRAEKLMDGDAFLLWCLEQEERYELVDGLPIKMMVGASRAHDRVVVNLIYQLTGQLRGSRCSVSTADIAIRTKLRTRRRADVIVTCDPPVRDRYDADDVKMIIEVLSPSNEGNDWLRKLEEYRALSGPVYILLIDTRVPDALLLTRTPVGWVDTSAQDLADIIELPAIGCRLALSDVYQNVELDVST